jgi:type II secretory pathway component GspD/PulD (secretin)
MIIPVCNYILKISAKLHQHSHNTQKRRRRNFRLNCWFNRTAILRKGEGLLSFHAIALSILSILLTMCLVNPVFADRPKEIVVTHEEEDIKERMQRSISLDVRDMNIIDVIKFLSIKGEFNVVISPTVQGRSTVFLNNVTIKDALDIIIVSNHLAYKVESNIIQIMTGPEFTSMYGKKFGDKTHVKIIRLTYSKPSYVLATLDNIKSNIGRIIIDEDTGSIVMIDTIEAIAKMEEAIKEIEMPVETYIYTLKYAEANDVANQLRQRIDAKSVGSVNPDERSNKLIVRAFSSRLDEIKKIIDSLDTPTKEVMVDARILQLTIKPQFDLGIDWERDFLNSSNKKFKKLSFESFNVLDGTGKSGLKHGQVAYGDFDADNFSVLLRSLRSVSDTKVLSNPQLLVTNNEEARIHIGDTVPYIISTTSGTGDSAITSEDVRFVDVGLKLSVRPIIHSDGFVTMQLRPEISSVLATVSSKGGGIPQINRTQLETTVLVKDGHTIIMGGLKKDDKVHSKRGFPVLMDIPILGLAFSRVNDEYTGTEIVIFITPHIVTGKEPYTDFKKKIKPFKSYSGKM